MFVEEGYWNYYMAFQVRSNADIIKCLLNEKSNKYVVASYMAGEVILNKDYGAVDDEKLKAYVEKYISVLGQTGDAIKDVHGVFANNTSFVSLLNPLKLLMNNGDEIICPIFMYLMNTGLGVLKLRVPILDLDLDIFKSMPLIKWYQSASILYVENNDISTAFSEDKSGTVADITELLQHVIQETFNGCLINEKMNLCFESLLLSKTRMPNILAKNFKVDDLRDIYHICFPEDTMLFPSNSVVNDFWRDKHKEIGGIGFIEGMPARLIIYMSGDDWLKANDRVYCQNVLEFLENSIQFSFDWTICVVLMKKLNVMNLFYSSDNNYHRINYNNAVYCLRENELDDMMDQCPVNCKQVYYLVYEIINLSTESYEKRVNRLFKLESYSKNLFEDKRNMLFEILALCGTTIFGLPAIRDTLTIIRDAFFSLNGDLVKFTTVEGLSVFVWVAIIIYMIIRVFKLFIQYKTYRL